MGTAVCCKSLVTGQPSPQLYAARPGLALSLLALAQSRLQALPTAALSQGPALQADPRTHPRTNLAGNSPVQGSPQCRDLPSARGPALLGTHQHSEIRAAGLQTQQLLPASPTPLLTWRSFNSVAHLQDLGGQGAVAITQAFTLCLPGTV